MYNTHTETEGHREHGNIAIITFELLKLTINLSNIPASLSTAFVCVCMNSVTLNHLKQNWYPAKPSGPTCMGIQTQSSPNFEQKMNEF